MPLSVFNSDQFNVDRFRAEVWKEFDVEPLTAFSSRSEPKTRKRKRERVNSTVDMFVELMNGPNPPATETEMLAALTPVMTWVLSWLIRQLVIQVLKYCWKRWNGERGTSVP